MYDWTRKKIQEYILANSANGFLYIKYTWQQLGLSQEWYDKMCRELTYDWLIIRREVDLVWTKSSDNSVFKEEQLDKLYQFVQTETTTLIIDVKKENKETKEIRTIPYAIKLLKILDPAKCYFVGCDVGGGTGRDYSTIIVTDPLDNFREVATFKSNVINLTNFRLLIEALIINHIPKSALFIENNSYGKGVIDELLDSPKVAKRIYFEYKIQDKDKTKSNPSKVTDTIQYGISTNTATRTLMIDIVKEIVEEEPESVVSEDVYNDIKGLIYSKSGKVEHDTTTHDDSLFGKLMVLYAVRYGNNVTRFLRDANELAKTKRRAEALSANNVLVKVIDDPATNKGLDINFDDLVRRIHAGDDINELKEHLLNGSKKGKPVDISLVKQLQSRNIRR